MAQAAYNIQCAIWSSIRLGWNYNSGSLSPNPDCCQPGFATGAPEDCEAEKKQKETDCKSETAWWELDECFWNIIFFCLPFF